MEPNVDKQKQGKKKKKKNLIVKGDYNEKVNYS